MAFPSTNHVARFPLAVNANPTVSSIATTNLGDAAQFSAVGGKDCWTANTAYGWLRLAQTEDFKTANGHYELETPSEISVGVDIYFADWNVDLGAKLYGVLSCFDEYTSTGFGGWEVVVSSLYVSSRYYLHIALMDGTVTRLSARVDAIPGGWHRFVFSDTGSGTELYVDGVSFASGSVARSDFQYKDEPGLEFDQHGFAAIGGRIYGYSTYSASKGGGFSLANIDFWDRAISSGEAMDDWRFYAGIEPIEIEVIEESSLAGESQGNMTFDGAASEIFDAVAGYGLGHIDGSLVETYSSGVIYAFLTCGASAGAALTAESILFAMVQDEAQPSDTASNQLAFGCSDGVSCASAISSAGSKYNHLASQALTVHDSIVFGFLAAAAETFQATDAATDKFEVALSIIERATVGGDLQAQLNAAGIVSVAMAMSEEWQAGKGAEASELATMTASVAQQANRYALILEGAILSAAATGGLVISAPLSAGVSITGEATPAQILQGLISEGVSFAVSFGAAGVTYSGMVMNTRTGAVSQYDELPFNSFAKIDGRYYGANSTGLYLLEGETRGGEHIDAVLTLGAMSFKGESYATVPEVFLDIKNDGGVVLSTLTDDKIERWYEVIGPSDVLREKRIPGARGLESRYWTFSLKNIDGAGFELRSIDPVPVVLKRR